MTAVGPRGFVRRVDIGPGAARLVLARPDKHNAVNSEMVDDAIRLLARMEEDGVQVAVLSADGATFCAGQDLRDTDWQTDGTDPAIFRLVDAMADAPVLWLAEVRGGAVGGALALLSACPVVLASQNAWFQLPEVSMDLFPVRVLEQMAQITGPRAAFDLALTGRRIDATEAAALGLVTTTLAEADLGPRVDDLALLLATHSAATEIGGRSWSWLTTRGASNEDTTARDLMRLNLQLSDGA